MSLALRTTMIGTTVGMLLLAAQATVAANRMSPRARRYTRSTRWWRIAEPEVGHLAGDDRIAASTPGIDCRRPHYHRRRGWLFDDGRGGGAGTFPPSVRGAHCLHSAAGVFVLGLLLIPLGIRLQRRAIRRDPTAADWPVVDLRKATVRRTVLAVTVLTVSTARSSCSPGTVGCTGWSRRRSAARRATRRCTRNTRRGRTRHIPTSHASTAMLARAGARW